MIHNIKVKLAIKRLDKSITELHEHVDQTNTHAVNIIINMNKLKGLQEKLIKMATEQPFTPAQYEAHAKLITRNRLKIEELDHTLNTEWTAFAR